MSFASPLGLLALLAVPVVLALHLFRRKFPERQVAGLFLFAPDRLSASSGRRRTRLLRTASLWLELAAAVLLALWLGGMSFGASQATVHAVFVLDDSVSMAAVHKGESSAARVRAKILAILKELPVEARATVITTGPRPEIILGPRELLQRVPSAIEEWNPWRSSHDAGPALDLGLEIAGRAGILWYLSDRLGIQAPPRYHQVAVGVARPNAAIMSARRHKGELGDAGSEQILADLMVFGVSRFDTVIEVIAVEGDQEKVLVREPVTLSEERPTLVSLKVPKTRAALTLRLRADALLVDNEFTLLPSVPRVVRLASTLDEEASLALDLERVLALVPNTRRAANTSAAHLVFRAKASSFIAGQNEVVVAPSPGEADAWIGPFLLERRHPILEGVTLEGVVWTAGAGNLEGLPLALAGSVPLCALETKSETMRLRLNLDPARSNLTSSPDWPILVANLIELVRTKLPGTEDVNLYVGDLMTWRHSGVISDAADLRLVDPGGLRRPGRGSRIVSWAARRTGIHVLENADEILARFSVNFADPSESDLRACASADQDALVDGAGESGDEDERHSGRSEARILALLLLLAVVGDWFVLRSLGGGR